MVKRRLPILLFLIFILCSTPQIVFADEGGNLAGGIIDFEEPIKEGYVSDSAISEYFQVDMWHHAGDYWTITYPTEKNLIGSTTNAKNFKTIPLNDSYAGEFWNDDNWLSEEIKKEGAVWILQCELSQGVKKRLNPSFPEHQTMFLYVLNSFR